MATRRHSRGSGPPVHVVIAWAGVPRPATGPCRVSNLSAPGRAASATSPGDGLRKHVRYAHRGVLRRGVTRAGGSVRARDLTLGMVLACTSLVANAVMSGDGSLVPWTAAALPEPFTIQGAAAGDPHRGGATVVATATALTSPTHPLTGSGLVVPGTATGLPDDGSLGRGTDGTVAPSGAEPVEPVESPVAVPPDAPPASDTVPNVPGDEPEGAVAPLLQPVTELLVPPATGATEATEPALSMLNPPLFA